MSGGFPWLTAILLLPAAGALILQVIPGGPPT